MSMFTHVLTRISQEHRPCSLMRLTFLNLPPFPKSTFLSDSIVNHILKVSVQFSIKKKLGKPNHIKKKRAIYSSKTKNQRSILRCENLTSISFCFLKEGNIP